MAHSGSKKGTKEWLQFQSEDKPAKSLGTKLVEEQRKRKAAEKEAAHWKALHKETKEKLDKELEKDNFYGDRNPPNR